MEQIMWPLSCKICSEKERLIEQLRSDLMIARRQIDDAKERERAAVNALLQHNGKPQISAPTRYEGKTADEATASLFGFFKDESDKGDGMVEEVDRMGMNPVP